MPVFIPGATISGFLEVDPVEVRDLPELYRVLRPRLAQIGMDAHDVLNFPILYHAEDDIGVADVNCEDHIQLLPFPAYLITEVMPDERTRFTSSSTTKFMPISPKMT